MADPPTPQRQQAISDQAENVVIPLDPGSWLILRGWFPLTESQWDQMMAVLLAMKSGLVDIEPTVEERICRIRNIQSERT